MKREGLIMSKKKNTKSIQCSNVKSHRNLSRNSKVPDDGIFIEYDGNDSFTPDKTTAYGEIQDVDDL